MNFNKLLMFLFLFNTIVNATEYRAGVCISDINGIQSINDEDMVCDKVCREHGLKHANRHYCHNMDFICKCK